MTTATPAPGGDPGLPGAITRRAMLTAAPAAVLAALPLPAQATAETPILSLYREYRRMLGATGELPSTITDEALEAACVPLQALERRIMAIPCTCTADLAAKMIVDGGEGSMLSDWETGTLWQEARELVGWEEGK